MKKLSYILILVFLVSCTSNTIFEKPKDLIPRDTMTMLIQDMIIASSAKFVINKNQQKKINYMPFIYDIYKIDSLRFATSNFYYTSKIDLYEEILNEAKTQIDNKKEFYTKMKSDLDSIRKDSIKKAALKLEELDTINLDTVVVDSLKTDIKKDTLKKKN
ncbi:DUF4296 domain-containing protein [uncultured Polaribacter sp.]|uniref:DUF4296 domain-containing protein n=1 Tax=uncultured Polaribacter sp. TaxID=174711 RepID=UPI0026111E43|nr:DUF4296 domain-containing protein [uncultured Polaribacter sp.]